MHTVGQRGTVVDKLAGQYSAADARPGNQLRVHVEEPGHIAAPHVYDFEAVDVT
jgi:hypothetical protein